MTEALKAEENELLVGPARPDDDPELRRLMREVAMPGGVSVAFGREPCFWHAAGIEGHTTDIVVARYGERIVGLGGYATRKAWVNGAVQDLGYLSMMRAEPGWRGQKLSTRGFGFIRQWMARDRAPFAISTVIADNARARAALEKPREGFPTFFPREKVASLFVPTWRRRARPKGVEVRPARPTDLGAIVRSLADANSARQFAPAWTEADLIDPVRCRGLALEDFLVAVQGDDVIGTVALWDQTAFKQTLIAGYQGLWKTGRPLLNAFAPLLNVPTLPTPGGSFSHGYLSHLSAREADLEITLALLLAGYERARERGLGAVSTGLSEKDPRLARVRKQLGGLVYWSMLYTVYDGSRCTAVDALDERPAHVEIAVL